MNINGVERTVLVQIIGNYDNEYLFECMREYPGRFGACVAVDPNREDSAANLEECVKKGAGGLRLSAKIDPVDARSLAVWRKADELRLAISVFGSEEDFASKRFHRVLEMFPNLKVAIEHYGKPGRDEAPPYTLFRKVLDLARFPNTYLKVGGLGEICDWVKPFRQPNPLSDVPAFLELALEAFGPKRLMFGSDFPPVAHREGYHNALQWLMDHLSYLKQDDLKWIFGETALGVWHFPEKQAP